MTKLIIKLPKQKAMRLGKHLLIEHPSTRNHIFIDRNKLKRKK